MEIKNSHTKFIIVHLIIYVEIPQGTLRRENHTTMIETPN
jgi:hypothetical protein